MLLYWIVLYSILPYGWEHASKCNLLAEGRFLVIASLNVALKMAPYVCF